MKQKIKVFDKIIMRNPTKPLGWFSSNNNNIDEFLKDSAFCQAVLLASPVLFREIEKYKQGKLTNKDAKRFEISILKYASRMSSRCTPFGLFSSVSIGNISDSDQFILSPIKNITKLDMSVLYLIFQKIESDNEVKEKLRYYPNTSLYQDRGHIYYTQEIYKGDYKKHTLFTINSSNDVKKIIKFANDGVTKRELEDFVVSLGCDRKNSEKFVNEMLANQVLISELYPYLTGVDYLHYINSLLKKYQITKYSLKLSKIEDLLNHIDENTSIKERKYVEIFNLLDTLELQENKEHRLQCDSFNQFDNFSIHKRHVEKVLDVIKFLNKITPRYINPDMSEFIQNYMKRYEGEELPLLQVMDETRGIGYRKTPKVDYLLSGLRFDNQNANLSFGQYERILLKKYIDAIKKGEKIVLNEKDFPVIDDNINELPDTFSAFFEVLDNKVIYNSAGFASATSLLGRFGQLKDIETFLNQISSFEQKRHPNEILAEIVHIPMSRVGNVLHRPLIREYEIPYLSNSHAKKILLSDLMVSVKGNEIKLRSKKLNKCIMPMMATAHNHSATVNLPIYSFLCGLETNNKKVNLMFNWGGVDNIFDYYPRVEYNDVIISMAKWKVNVEEMSRILKLNAESRVKCFEKWKENRNIPKYVQISSRDNKLFLDLDIEPCIEVFLSEIKRVKEFYIEEYPRIDEQSIVKTGNDVYNNQFILSLYKCYEKDR